MERGYAVRPLTQVGPEDGGKTVYLRHDVDYSMALARDLAAENATLGIEGCFFVPVSSPIINLRAADVRADLAAIADLGQPIGLHFYLPEDLRDREATSFDLIAGLIAEEYDLLRRLVPRGVVPAMSWHNPGVLGNAYSDWIQADLPGLTNAYALARKGIGYRADSNLRYSVEEWLAFADSEPDRLQVLIHPFQWSCGATRMEDILTAMFGDHIRLYDRLLADNDVYKVRLPKGLPPAAIDALLKDLRSS